MVKLQWLYIAVIEKLKNHPIMFLKSPLRKHIVPNTCGKSPFCALQRCPKFGTCRLGTFSQRVKKCHFPHGLGK